MRLLLAEGEKALSRALVTILERSHYGVDAVYNGRDALDYLRCGEYDGVILDIMMPEMDGITVLKTIRAQGSRVPVLLLTAKSEVDDKVEGLDSGANDYLTKPFQAKELLARIRAMTRTATAQPTARLQLGNITLDRATFELSGPGGAVRLAGREFQVMELLLRNPRQLIPAERFLEKIWGPDSDAEINVVWVYLSNLRKSWPDWGPTLPSKPPATPGIPWRSCHDRKTAQKTGSGRHGLSAGGAAGHHGGAWPCCTTRRFSLTPTPPSRCWPKTAAFSPKAWSSRPSAPGIRTPHRRPGPVFPPNCPLKPGTFLLP